MGAHMVTITEENDHNVVTEVDKFTQHCMLLALQEIVGEEGREILRSE